MSKKTDGGFQLRTYIFIDRIQPQLAQFIAKDNRVNDPNEYDAAIMLELAPAMEIHKMIDLALKSTSVRLGSVVTERQYGLMQIQHQDQGEVQAAGASVLEQTGLTSGTVYPALERLEGVGLARSKWEDAEVAHQAKRPSRRYFEITTAGKEELIRGLERYKALAPLTIDGVAHPQGVDRA